MTNVTVSEGNLICEVEGWDKLWSLRSRLVIPLQHVSRVYADANVSRGWFSAVRVGGTYVPGVISAGTFYQHGDWVFWDVHNSENAVVIELHDERYAKLIVEVADPAETVARVTAAVPKA